jgi:hypothetical protein
VRGALIRLIVGALLIALIVWGQDIVGLATAGSRLDPSLRGMNGPVNVIVVLDFIPESFHNERLRRYGVFAGRDKTVNRVRLRMVTPENLQLLSRIVWVSRIEPAG